MGRCHNDGYRACAQRSARKGMAAERPGDQGGLLSEGLL